MSDSKARLHCCGTHHGASGTPTGLPLTISTARGPVRCYGTGENPAAAVILVPEDEGYGWTGVAVRVLCDVIARGANVTVLVPDLTAPDSRKRRRDEDEEGEGVGVNVGEAEEGDVVGALARTLKESMDVTHLGLLRPSDRSTVVVDLVAQGIDCLVTFAPPSPSPSRVPTLHITLSPTESADATSTRTGDGDDAVTVRTVTVKSAHLNRVLVSDTHEGYPETMKEVLYFFKKHLHDWS